MRQAPVKAQKPTGEEVEVAEVFVLTGDSPAPAPLPASLPATASVLPLIGLAGLISLALAGMMKLALAKVK